jgi:hypothetical protein
MADIFKIEVVVVVEAEEGIIIKVVEVIFTRPLNIIIMQVATMDLLQ